MPSLLIYQPSLDEAVEANRKIHFVAEAVPRGTILFQYVPWKKE